MFLSSETLLVFYLNCFTLIKKNGHFVWSFLAVLYESLDNLCHYTCVVCAFIMHASQLHLF
jgi:hypothetical protein